MGAAGCLLLEPPLLMLMWGNSSSSLSSESLGLLAGGCDECTSINRAERRLRRWRRIIWTLAPPLVAAIVRIAAVVRARAVIRITSVAVV